MIDDDVIYYATTGLFSGISACTVLSLLSWGIRSALSFLRG